MAFAYQGRSVSPASASRPAAIARRGELGRDRRQLVGEHRRERRHREQLRWRRPVRGGALANGVAPPGHPRCGRDVDDPDADRHGLQTGGQRFLAWIDQRRGAIEHTDRRGRSVRAPEREREHHRGRDPPTVVAGAVERRLQVVGPPAQPGARFGHAELEQQTRQLSGRWRLDQHPAQVHRRGLRCAAARGGAGRPHQPLHHPRVGRRVRQQQVLGHALVGARIVGEQVRRLAMAAASLAAGELGVDAGAHDRVRERQRSSRLEDLGGGQQVGRRRRLLVVELGQSRGLLQVAALEDRHRAGQTAGVRGQPVEPQHDRAAHGPGADPLDVRGRRRGRLDLFVAQRGDELAHQERRPSGRAAAGVGERPIGRAAQPGLDELARRPSLVSGARRSTSAAGSVVSVASSPASAPDSRGRAPTTRSRPAPRAAAAGTPGTATTGSRPNARRRRRCTPGPAGGEVGAQPVEAVEDRERRIRPDGHRAARSEVAPGRPSSSAATPGRALEQLGALGRTGASASGSSSSWRTTPNANSRSSCGARAPAAAASRRACASASAARASRSYRSRRDPRSPASAVPSRPASEHSITASCSPRSSSSAPPLAPGRAGRRFGGPELRCARRSDDEHSAGGVWRRLARAEDRAERPDAVGCVAISQASTTSPRPARPARSTGTPVFGGGPGALNDS